MKTYEFQIAQTIVEKGFGFVEAETLDEAEEKIRELLASQGADAVSWNVVDVAGGVSEADVYEDEEMVRTIAVEM